MMACRYTGCKADAKHHRGVCLQHNTLLRRMVAGGFISDEALVAKGILDPPKKENHPVKNLTSRRVGELLTMGIPLLASAPEPDPVDPGVRNFKALIAYLENPNTNITPDELVTLVERLL